MLKITFSEIATKQRLIKNENPHFLNYSEEFSFWVGSRINFLIVLC
jgi:hypothetical protein